MLYPVGSHILNISETLFRESGYWKVCDPEKSKAQQANLFAVHSSLAGNLKGKLALVWKLLYRMRQVFVCAGNLGILCRYVENHNQFGKRAECDQNVTV